jgi:hypothetical protein
VGVRRRPAGVVHREFASDATGDPLLAQSRIQVSQDLDATWATGASRVLSARSNLSIISTSAAHSELSSTARPSSWDRRATGSRRREQRAFLVGERDQQPATASCPTLTGPCPRPWRVLDRASAPGWARVQVLGSWEVRSRGLGSSAPGHDPWSPAR